MRFHKFDIVLVRFPFSDLSKAKLRPALVVRSLPGANVILCQISTKKRRIENFEIPLKREDCKGNIRFDSRVYVDMVFTPHCSLILRTLGDVGNHDVCKRIDAAFLRLFGESNSVAAAA